MVAQVLEREGGDDRDPQIAEEKILKEVDRGLSDIQTYLGEQAISGGRTIFSDLDVPGDPAHAIIARQSAVHQSAGTYAIRLFNRQFKRIPY